MLSTMSGKRGTSQKNRVRGRMRKMPRGAAVLGKRTVIHYDIIKKYVNLRFLTKI